MVSIYNYGGARWRKFLRHCASSRKVAGSFPDLTLPAALWTWATKNLNLREMSTRDISWGEGVKAAGAQS